VIFFDKSRPAHRRGHLGDVADLRRQVDAIELTLSVKSFQVPETPSTSPARDALSVPTSRATRVTSPAKALSWSTIVFDGFLQLKDFALS